MGTVWWYSGHTFALYFYVFQNDSELEVVSGYTYGIYSDKIGDIVGVVGGFVNWYTQRIIWGWPRKWIKYIASAI